MVVSIETSAGLSRLLHRQVKVLLEQLEEVGLGREFSYAILLNVILRLAYEDGGEGAVDALRGMLQE